eukprot:403345638
MEKSANKKSTPSQAKAHTSHQSSQSSSAQGKHDHAKTSSKHAKPKHEQENDHDSSQDEHMEDIQGDEKQRTILYDILGVQKSATPDDIKKAYRRLALLKHPDKNPNDAQASENFQKLQKAYQILSDPKKRERYDQYGDDGENGGDVFSTGDWLDAYEYYRAMHPEVTKKDVKDYSQRYRHSKDEEEDLIDFYLDNDGDITHILEHIVCCVNEDVDRFVKFFEDQIELGELDDEKAFHKSKKHIKLLPDEKEEAKKEKSKLQKKKEKAAKDAGVGNMHDLEKMILAKRQSGFNGFLNYMTDKYANANDEDDDMEEEKKGGKKAKGKAKNLIKTSTAKKGKNNKDLDEDENMWEDNDEEDEQSDSVEDVLTDPKNINSKRIKKAKAGNLGSPSKADKMKEKNQKRKKLN